VASADVKTTEASKAAVSGCLPALEQLFVPQVQASRRSVCNWRCSRTIGALYRVRPSCAESSCQSLFPVAVTRSFHRSLHYTPAYTHSPPTPHPSTCTPQYRRPSNHTCAAPQHREVVPAASIALPRPHHRPSSSSLASARSRFNVPIDFLAVPSQ
jgi:hypothetical protein